MRLDVLSRKNVPQILTFLYNHESASVDHIRRSIHSYSASNLLSYLERVGFVKSEMSQKYKIYTLTDIGIAYGFILNLPDEKVIEIFKSIR